MKIIINTKGVHKDEIEGLLSLLHEECWDVVEPKPVKLLADFLDTHGKKCGEDEDPSITELMMDDHCCMYGVDGKTLYYVHESVDIPIYLDQFKFV